MSHFRRCHRDTLYLLPPSVDEWLPKDRLARFVVDIVAQLDLSALARQYRGAGSAAYHPGMLVALLIYGYATGIYRADVSSRPLVELILGWGFEASPPGLAGDILSLRRFAFEDALNGTQLDDKRKSSSDRHSQGRGAQRLHEFVPPTLPLRRLTASGIFCHLLAG